SGGDMNKRLIAISVALAICTGFVMTTVAGAVDTDRPTLRVATDTSFPPFEFRDNKTGQYVGFDMDLLKEVAKRAGFDYDLKVMSFPGMIPALQAGQLDIAIAAIDITDKRKKAVDFSIPYYHHSMRLMVPSDDDSIKDLSDLAGKRVSTKIGSSDLAYLQEHAPDAKVTPYPETADMYMAVLSGNPDAAFYDSPNMEYFIKKKGKDRVRLVGPSYNPVGNGFTFP